MEKLRKSVCVRERERQIERERQRERQRDREKDRESGRDYNKSHSRLREQSAKFSKTLQDKKLWISANAWCIKDYNVYNVHK